VAARRLFAALAGLCLLEGCATWGAAPASVRREPGWQTVPEVRAFAQTGPRDCGPAALASVLNHWEPSLDLETVRRLTGPPDEVGVAAGRLRAVARQRGLRAHLISGTLEDLDRELGAGRPVLVGLVETHRTARLTHYQVVAGHHPSRALLLTADPARGWRVIPVDQFLAEWEPTRRLTLVVSP
jgi:ABC-type bacteriocin/lantibiotic exporter with double-glycine peptidase domain